MATTPKRIKRSCKLTTDLIKKYPFIHKASDKSESDVYCNTCGANFSIANGGSWDIERHISHDKHKNAAKAIGKSSLTKYYRNDTFGHKEKELAKIKALWSFHTVYHTQSFNSMECTSKIIQQNFDEKFSCGKTKCEAIAKNVIAPFFEIYYKENLVTLTL